MTDLASQPLHRHTYGGMS